MPTIDDPGLDPQRRERIRSRTLEKGTKMRRRRTIARRSVTATAVVVLAGGGVFIARAAGVTSSAPPHQKISVAGESTTTIPFNTGTTGGTGTGTTSTTTTIPFAASTGTTGGGTTGGGSSTTTTPPPTTTVPQATTTIPVTPTTLPTPVGSDFQKSLSDVEPPGTLGSSTWTVPASSEFELSKFMLSAGSSSSTGEIRVQLLSTGANPETLFEVDFGQLSSPYEVALSTPVPFAAGQQVVLTATCDSQQPACTATLSFSGKLWTTGPFDHAYANGLDDVVAPGTPGLASWTVPAGKTFSMSDFVLSSISSGQTGEVYVQTMSGGSPTTILQISLADLGKHPVDSSLGSLVLSAGDSLELNLTCNGQQAACNATLLFTGNLT